MAVTPSTSAIERLKIYVDAGEQPILSDADLTNILRQWAIVDSNGNFDPDGVNWESFDFYGAAEMAWNMKHGRAAKLVNMDADGQRFDLSEIRKACLEQIAYYRNLRSTGSITVDGLDTY